MTKNLLDSISRRRFLALGAGAALGTALAGQPLFAAEAAPGRRYKKALKINMFPAGLSDDEKFALAARAGYEGVDGVPLETDDAIERQAELARRHGVPLHGLVFGWAAFGEPDEAARERDIERMQTALRQARLIGATSVLLVPARVTETVRYAEAWERSIECVRRLIPAAAEAEVPICIENVWSRFLLSPLEFRRYLDELDSPWVRAYFDVGNVIIQGHAQDWIRELGPRIIKLDLKDFRRRGFEWVNLGEGDVNWPEVRAALAEIDFSGWATCELKAGDEAYLTDISARIDQVMTEA